MTEYGRRIEMGEVPAQTEKSIKWEGEDLITHADVLRVVLSISLAQDKEAAQKFILAYMRAGASEVDVRNSIGYLAGYYDWETTKKVFDTFNVSHPIFGRIQPTPTQAFQAGLELGQKWKKT